MENFADRLRAAVRRTGNPICLGLDPRWEQLPAFLRARAEREHGSGAKAAAEAFLAFNRGLLDALAGRVPVCKPQIAFYEEYGAEGLRAFAETAAHARRRGFLVVSDAKRGDIGATAEAYARAHLSGDGFDADAVTVNPYLGADSLAPFVAQAASSGKGVFVLVKTSNPGSGDLQDLPVAAQGSPARPLYEHVAELVSALGARHRGACGYSCVGAVAGATYPAQLARLRRLCPGVVFLIPGYGAQGGTAKDAAAGFDAEGFGAIVNNSRGLCLAFQREPYSGRFGEEGYTEAARAAAEQMAEELRGAANRG